MLSEAKRELLERRLRGEHTAPRPRAPRPDGPIPVSYVQERMWFLAQLNPGATEYNTSVPIPFDEAVDVPALTASLTALVERHEALRTRLVGDEAGVPHQVIDPPAPFPLRHADVADQADPEHAAHALVAEETWRPFDLAAGPLIRGLLIRIADDRYLLGLMIHHAATDEWSNRIITSDLRALYAAARSGTPCPLPPLPIQYADYAIRQRQALTPDVLERQLGYWRELLADPPVLELPTDHPRPANRDHRGAARRFEVPAHVVTGLRDLARRHEATMFMTLLAAYGTFLHRRTGQDDLLIGTPIADRDEADAETIVGCLVNTMALRFTFGDDPTFAELLQRVRAQALASYAYQDTPFGSLVEELVRDRDLSQPPLVQTFFNYYTHDAAQGERVAMNDSDDRKIVDALVEGLSVDWDLRLIFVETATGLNGALEYSTSVFEHDTISRVTGHVLTLLEGVVANPDLPVSQLPLLSPAELPQATTPTEFPAVGGV
ncbi:condensation domain-containing protein, partial [Micromonospora chersina]|uniref:condensation domain-containing protein n=1 Tax=Micromonospora chersina TaxID=47854 RepID=UPI003710F142